MPASRLWSVLPFLLLLLAFSGCDLFGNDDRVCCDRNAPLLPLTVGNEWVLSTTIQDSVRYDTVRVPRTRTIAGHSYFVVESSSRAQTMRVRSDEQGRIYQFRDGSEHLWLDPTVSDDGSYSYSGPNFEYTVRVTRNVTVETPADSFENGIRFWFDAPDVVDEEYGHTLVPGVGFVRYSTVWVGPWLLTSYPNREDPK